MLFPGWHGFEKLRQAILADPIGPSEFWCFVDDEIELGMRAKFGQAGETRFQVRCVELEGEQPRLDAEPLKSCFFEPLNVELDVIRLSEMADEFIESDAGYESSTIPDPVVLVMLGRQKVDPLL
jgi:hypothetical protein